MTEFLAKKQLKESGYVLAQGLSVRVQSAMLGKGSGNRRRLVPSHLYWGSNETHAGAQPHILLFVKLGTPAYRMVLLTTGMGLPSSVKPLGKLLHKNAQRNVS